MDKDDDIIICKKCFSKNGASRKTCWNCEAELENKKINSQYEKFEDRKSAPLEKLIGLGLISFIIIMFLVAVFTDSHSYSSSSYNSVEYCIESGCTNERASGSSYCYLHKPTTYSSSSNSSYSSSSSSSKKYFTNNYGTSTTKCYHSGCNNYIASSGDTNCCIIHSSTCGICGCYIDEDAAFCMDCISDALYN